MSFILLILDWYSKNKRPLAWRNTTNPYNIWLSEIILQQTRIAQGTDYYHTFVTEFPTVESLAKADEQKVLNLWQGLGYYSRARNLHYTAKYIVEQHNGKFPRNYKELLKLKGVGPYTAAAIASICFDEKIPAIDGNAYRVYARLFDIELDISSSKAHKYFFDFATEIMPKEKVGDFNQAIMELGATICTPTNPQCPECPVSKHCVAFAKNKQKWLPIKSKKVKVKKREFNYVLVHDGEKFLIRKRTEKDVWQNLYDFPLQNEFTQNQQSFFHKISTNKHILTHQKLTLTFWEYAVKPTELAQLEIDRNATCISHEELTHYPLPKPIENFCKTEIHEFLLNLENKP